MPVFEYKCGQCGKISEFLENSGRRSAKICQHCNSKDLHKQFSVFAAGIKQGQSKRCYDCSDGSCPHSAG